MLAQALLNGAIGGLLLAVVTLGFSLVCLPCRVFYVALARVYASPNRTRERLVDALESAPIHIGIGNPLRCSRT